MVKNKDPYAPVRNAILSLLTTYVKKSDKILEVGAATGHISSALQKKGYKNVSGLEIRPDIVRETKLKNPDFDITVGDVFKLNKKYDAIWNSGLIQCLNDDMREKLIKKFAESAPIGIFITPRRDEYLPARNNAEVAVAGCEEFPTDQIATQLAKYYKIVRIGKMPREVIELEEEFIYYVCIN